MAEAFSSQHTSTFPEFLAQTGISLLVSTYQAGKLIMLRHQDGVLNTHFVDMQKPMGIALQDPHLAVGSSFQLTHYFNMPDVGAKVEPQNTHNSCYVPREVHITGDIDIHEMSFTTEGELWLVNTKMSCLCTLDTQYSVVPQWRPPFISGYDLTDRCHLNGLAMKDGKPTYVSALGTTDTAAGWRENKAAGGMLMDIRDNKMIASGLSMPHSPRWYQDKLWVLESGAGTLATVDLETGNLTTIVELPGFTRGIDFIGRYAIIGLSQVRETAVFAGLPLTERCEERQCGIYIVDIEEKKVVAYVMFSGDVQEIFSVQILPSSFPAVLSMEDPLLRSTYAIPDEALKDLSEPDPEQTRFEEANILAGKGKFDEAIKAYKSYLADFPDKNMAYINLGMTYLNASKWKEAVDSLQDALKRESHNADAQNSLGQAWAGLHEWENAIDSYDKAILIDQQFAAAHVNRAMILLRQGKFKEGFETFEWRWKIPGLKSLDCSQPQWKGENISDKTILVHTEQSNSDIIQFARFIPLLAKHCKKVIVLCPEPFRLFFKGVGGVNEVRLPNQVKNEDFDYYVPIMSLANTLKITLKSLPAETPYWSIPTEVAVPKLKTDKSLKVGLIWKSDPTGNQQATDTCSAEQLLQLTSSFENIQFYNLQTPTTEDEAKLLKQRNVINLESELVSYAHAGAILKQLDLLISVDSSIAHLSASLGIKTQLLLNQNSHWTWMDDRNDSPWYPSLKLLRKGEFTPWESMISQVTKSLRH